MPDDIEHRFTYHAPPDDETRERHELVRDLFKHCAHSINAVVQPGEASREKSLAITKLEEAMFWANAAIARSHK